jgi:hypothetical protein
LGHPESDHFQIHGQIVPSAHSAAPTNAPLADGAESADDELHFLQLWLHLLPFLADDDGALLLRWMMLACRSTLCRRRTVVRRSSP